MIIPIQEVDRETLCNIVEGFVLREGTDYGSLEFNLQDKVEQVLGQLESGDALLVYSELHETVNIVPKAQFIPDSP